MYVLVEIINLNYCFYVYFLLGVLLGFDGFFMFYGFRFINKFLRVKFGFCGFVICGNGFFFL